MAEWKNLETKGACQLFGKSWVQYTSLPCGPPDQMKGYIKIEHHQ